MYFDIDCLKGLKGRHWTLSESAAIWDFISQRALQSWVSGQTLRIRPSCGPRRFGLLSQFKFGIAIRLLKAKLPTKAIQTFLDYSADARLYSYCELRGKDARSLHPHRRPD